MQTARSRFSAWVEWLRARQVKAKGKPLSQQDVADLLECKQATVSQLLSGDRSAGLELAVMIEKKSADWPRGPIRVAEWCEPKPKQQGAKAS